MPDLTLGFSPCPNDTYIFDAWVNGRLGADAPPVQPQLADVETLNRWAQDGRLDVTKLSFPAFARVRDRYSLLNAGGALGFGCGPLIVAKRPYSQAELTRASVAIPGALTTANLLLHLYQPQVGSLRVLQFDEIMPAVAAGVVDAGVIIHESRFTYPQYGLQSVVDLGQWWEQTTGLPIPLGGIAAKTALGAARLAQLEATIRASLRYARAHPAAPLPYMRAHAQEMDPAVMQQHIDLYVNDFSLDYGEKGKAVIELLLRKVEAHARR